MIVMTFEGLKVKELKKKKEKREKRRRVITSNHQKWDGWECKTNK
jgi:hypothetical protein